MKSDKDILLNVCDGSEGIEIYTSDNEGTKDWSVCFPALYIEITMYGIMIKLGPFTFPKIYTELRKKIKE